MIKKIVSGSGHEYTINTEELTCTCADFRYRRSHFPITSENRLCKHLKEEFEVHPEFAPAWYQLSSTSNGEPTEEPSADPDGKVRRSRELFEPFVSEIRACMKLFDNLIDISEFCGSYRRRCSRISDLDVLIVLNDNQLPDEFLDYLENTMGYERLWRGNKKASYKIMGFIQVDFKFVPKESWAFSTLHFTGSKYSNIELRKRALSRGYSLSEYGFTTKDGNLSTFGCKTEKDIYNFIGVPYKEPWERNQI